MIRAFSLLFTFYTALAFGQDTGIPLPVRVPAGSRLVAHTYAKGFQVYVCTRDPKDSARYTWVFKEPRAVLYTDSSYHEPAGRHFLNTAKNPAWELNNGSKISGVKIMQTSPPDTSAIPWLLLSATSDAMGTLAPVQFIQRIRTRGGKAPASPGKHREGQSIEVPYTAEYLFYTSK